MFALRVYTFGYQKYIRADGISTVNKAAAKLFDTENEAKVFALGCRAATHARARNPSEVVTPIEIVEVETRPIMKKFVKVTEVV